MAAHTDLTYICLACLTRVPPSTTCPACRRPEVVALEEPDTEAKVKVRLESRSRRRTLPQVFYRWGDAMFFGLIALIHMVLAWATWEHWRLSLVVAPEIALFAWCSVNDQPTLLRRPRRKASRRGKLRELWAPTSLGPKGLVVRLCLPLGLVIAGLALWFQDRGSGWGEALLSATIWVIWGWPSILAAVWVLRDVLFKGRGFTIVLVIAALCGVVWGIFETIRDGDSSLKGWVLGGAAAALLLGILLTDLCRLAHLQYMEDALKPPEVRLFEAPAPGTGARTVTGRVEADVVLTAPLSGETCVAFRITCDHPRGPIDDGRCLAFTVVTDDGERVPVEVEQAWLELPAITAGRTTRLEGELQEFLRRRGVTDVELELDEGLLREGDRVAVTGQVETRLRPEGYRGMNRVETLVGRVKARLVIRALAHHG